MARKVIIVTLNNCSFTHELEVFSNLSKMEAWLKEVQQMKINYRLVRLIRERLKKNDYYVTDYRTRGNWSIRIWIKRI